MRNFPIIEALGGDEEALEVLRRRRGRKLTSDALRMWRARGSIPGDAQRHLMAEADERRITYHARDFAIPDGEAAE